MQIKNKYYPYPVIAAGNDSYEDATFTSDADYAMDAHNVKLILCAETDNQMLNEMIKSGSVKYAHHIECQQTCFRKLVLTDEKVHEEIIHESLLNGIVQICTFLMAKFVCFFDTLCSSRAIYVCRYSVGNIALV